MLLYNLYLCIVILITVIHYVVATNKSNEIMDLIGRMYDVGDRGSHQIVAKWSIDHSFDRGRRSLPQATGEDERRSETDH